MMTRKTKKCLSCGHPWPLTAKYWHRNRSSADGYQARCKACNIKAVREWQDANRDRYLASQQGRVRVHPLRAELIEYKESHPCADCGLFWPYYVMQFDHTGDDKTDDVSRMARDGYWHLRGRDRLLAEIEKCDLVCANCHALRTHDRWLLSKAAIRSPVQRAPVTSDDAEEAVVTGNVTSPERPRRFRHAGHPMVIHS
jgi:hypothetical protein